MTGSDTQPGRRKLAVLMFTDLTDSVGMKRRLGAEIFGQTLSRHDDIFKALIASTPGALILKDLGDGFYASFASAGDAVNVGLKFQWQIHHEQWPAEQPQPRVGIHVGELIELAPESDGRAKMIGLDADLTARVMGLSEGGQILMTRGAFDSARQTVREHPPVSSTQKPAIAWQAYGFYQFKGMEGPHEVFEVGAEGLAPLHAPADSEKARRASASPDPTLGWRPAVGLEIPDRPGWTLEGRLGEGGFGEVWLAINRDTTARRAFKFCFDAERLRSFRREVMLFKRLADALGDRNDIARLYDTRFDRAPYFIESEYSQEGNLLAWSMNVGGIGSLPMSTRLDLFWRIARALGAAHTADIIHKDLKPGNILITLTEDGSPRPKLADFGVGQVVASEFVPAASSPVSPSLIGGNLSSRTGSRLYAAPEVGAQQPPDKRSDVYSLGVLLYQLAIGRLDRPLATGWERSVADARLRDLIAWCVDVDPARRPTDATAVAERAWGLIAQRSHSVKRVIALAVCALVLLGAVWTWWSMSRSTRTAAIATTSPPVGERTTPIKSATTESVPAIPEAADPAGAAPDPSAAATAPISKPPAHHQRVSIDPTPPAARRVSVDQLQSELRRQLPLAVNVIAENPTQSVKVSGVVLNDSEKTEVTNIINRFKQNIAVDRLAVDPQGVATLVQQALRDQNITNRTREYRRSSDGPWYLRVVLYNASEADEKRAREIAGKYVIDWNLISTVRE